MVFFSFVERVMASLLLLVWVVVAGAELGGWGVTDEFLVTEAFLPFFSRPVLGTMTSRVGGSFRGVPSSPGKKDRKEQ